MPTFNKRQGEPEDDQSRWFIITPGSDHPLTFQVEPEGYNLLLNSGLEDGDDVDWDIFQTLQSLGLLYTLNSSYTPEDAPVPDSLTLNELSFSQRLEMAKQLLEGYTVTELCEWEGTFKFFRSFADDEWDDIEPVLEIILDETPFHPIVLADWEVTFDEGPFEIYRNVEYSPILLSLALRVGYDALGRGEIEVNEGNPIWKFDGWIVYAGNELMYYSINDTFIEAFPAPLASALEEASKLPIATPEFYEFFENDLASLFDFEFIKRVQQINSHLGIVVADGLNEGDRSHVVMVPGDVDDANEPFETDYL